MDNVDARTAAEGLSPFGALHTAISRILVVGESESGGLMWLSVSRSIIILSSLLCLDGITVMSHQSQI